VVRLGGALWRIDRVEEAGARTVEAARVEDGTWVPQDMEPEPPRLPPFAPPSPVEAVFLDLPLLTGEESPHAPHVAFASRPWPGSVTLAASDADADYRAVLTQTAPATMGTTLSPLPQAAPGLWDRGAALRVRLLRGSLASAAAGRVLAGANAAAIGDGEDWEVLQFAEAQLVAPLTWDLRLRLRGQAGTEGVVPPVWPAGSRFVLLDGTPAQWPFPASLRDRLRHYRWGPSGRAMSDPSWRHGTAVVRGVGLRPYAVCHLRAKAGPDGLDIAWIRRTRIDGDSWSGLDVPLGEEREAYLVRVTRGAVQLREVEVSGPRWLYAAHLRVEDGSGAVTVAVAQVSDRFGPGPFRILEVT
jgi:hypothetical protein